MCFSKKPKFSFWSYFHEIKKPNLVKTGNISWLCLEAKTKQSMKWKNFKEFHDFWKKKCNAFAVNLKHMSWNANGPLLGRHRPQYRLSWRIFGLGKVFKAFWAEGNRKKLNHTYTLWDITHTFESNVTSISFVNRW